MSFRSKPFICLSAASALALAGLQCKSSNTDEGQTPYSYGANQPGGSASSANSPSQPDQKSPGSSAETGTGDNGTLSDSEIAALTAAANRAEVEQGRLAQDRASDQRVRDFAAMMVNEHGNALQEQQDLAIQPVQNQEAQHMSDKAQDQLESLKDKSGSDFDRAYMQLQVDEHQKVLDKINHQLLPSAKSQELTTYLQDLQSEVQSHLNEAQQLQNELGATSRNGSAPR